MSGSNEGGKKAPVFEFMKSSHRAYQTVIGEGRLVFLVSVSASLLRGGNFEAILDHSLDEKLSSLDATMPVAIQKDIEKEK